MKRATRTRVSRAARLERLEEKALLTSVPFAGALVGSGQILNSGSAVDAQGEVYLGGLFQGEIDFDPGPAEFRRTSTSAAGDGFFAKYSPQGQLLWWRTITVPQGQAFVFTGLETGSADELVAIGAATDGVDLDPGAGTTPAATGGFILTLNADGSFSSTQRFTSTAENVADTAPSSVEVNAQGAVFVSGRLIDGVTDLNPGEGTRNVTGSNDGYLVKLNPDRSFAFASVLASGASSTATAISLAVGPGGQGDIYLVGSFSGTVDFDPGAGTQSRTSAQPAIRDAFLLRLSAQGQFLGVATASGTEFGQFNSIELITSGDTVEGVATIGAFIGGATVGGGVPPLQGIGVLDVVVARWSPSLAPTWSRILGNQGNDVPTSLTIDSAGNLSFGGTFSGTLDLDPGPATSNVTALGTTDAYLVTLNGDGNLVRGQQFGGEGDEELNQVLSPISDVVRVNGSYTGASNVLGVSLPALGDGERGFFFAAIDFRPDTIPPTIAQLGPVDPSTRTTPVSSVDLIFSELIDPGTFGLGAVSLTRNGQAVDLSGVTLDLLPGSPSRYLISNLQAATTPVGTYVLTVDASGVVDLAGNGGTGSAQVTFTVQTDGGGGGGGGSDRLIGDYDGDGVADLALYRFENGVGRFALRLSNNGTPSEIFREIANVDSNVIPVAGDFDGDGLTDIAVVNPTATLGGGSSPNASVWIILDSANGHARREVPFGAAGVLDRPAPADYDGDGITDIATFRADSDLVPGAAQWFILPSSNNSAFDVLFGAAGGVDLPAPFDFDGDGRAEIATFRPISDLVPGAAQWFVLPSQPNPGFQTTTGGFSVTFGAAGNADQPAVADYDGDGKDDINAFRSESDLAPGNAQWFILPSAPNQPNYVTTNNGFAVTFGQAGEIAAVSNYRGDNRPDLTVFNPTNGAWSIRDGLEGAAETISYNPLGAGAVPVLSPLFFRLRATNNIPNASVASDVEVNPLLINAADGPVRTRQANLIDAIIDRLLDDDAQGLA